MVETSSCLELWSEEESLPGITFPIRKTYPLNSRRMVASQLQVLAKLLELPTGASASETRQLIKGRLLELSYQSGNVEVVIEEEEGGNSTRILLVNESGIIRNTGAQEIIHPLPSVSIPCSATFVNNIVRQHHTVSPVNNGDGDALELRSALREARRNNERLERVLSEQSLLLQKVTKQLEDTKDSAPSARIPIQRAGCARLIVHQRETPNNVPDIMEEALVDIDGEERQGRGLSSSSVSKGVSIHWTGILDWTTGLSYFPFWISLCIYL